MNTRTFTADLRVVRLHVGNSLIEYIVITLPLADSMGSNPFEETIGVDINQDETNSMHWRGKRLYVIGINAVHILSFGSLCVGVRHAVLS